MTTNWLQTDWMQNSLTTKLTDWLLIDLLLTDYKLTDYQTNWLQDPFSSCHTIWRLAITCNWSPSLLGHQQTHTVCMSYHQYFVIIFFQRSAFNLPSLILFFHTLLYSLCSENFIFQIHLFTFKFISFIFTPYKILLLHSHLFNIQKPMYLTIQK